MKGDAGIGCLVFFVKTPIVISVKGRDQKNLVNLPCMLLAYASGVSGYYDRSAPILYSVLSLHRYPARVCRAGFGSFHHDQPNYLNPGDYQWCD